MTTREGMAFFTEYMPEAWAPSATTLYVPVSKQKLSSASRGQKWLARIASAAVGISMAMTIVPARSEDGASTLAYAASHAARIAQAASTLDGLIRGAALGSPDPFSPEIIRLAEEAAARPVPFMNPEEWAAKMLPYIVNARD